MELRSVEELMDLLYACRGERPGQEYGGEGPAGPDLHGHALRTAALLRRRRPADKELQVAGLVSPVGRLPWPGNPAVRTADAVRPLLGARVARLLRRHARAEAWAHDDDVVSLRQADEEARTAVFDAGVLEDWRSVLEMTAARNARLGAVD